MYLTQPLHKAYRERPGLLALVCGERRQTFGDLYGKVRRVAGMLQEMGVGPNDRVGMLSVNSDHYIEYLYGTWWAGAVVNPVNIRWSAREVAYSLDDCDTQVLLVDDTFVELAREVQGLSSSLKTLVYVGHGTSPEGMLDYHALVAAARPAADAMRQGSDLAAVMYTGGTTGLPKGVMLTHGNLYTGQLGAIAGATRPDNAIGLHAAPMFHVGGIGLVLQLMLRLCPQIVLPGFDEVAILQAIHTERASETFLVPTMLKRVIEHPRFDEFDISSLSLVLYGAAPVDEALLERAMQALPQASFIQLYGMTELSPVITALPAWCHEPEHRTFGKLRSAGRPTPVAEVRIVDADDLELPVGEVGEIAARGPMVMAGYWNKPEQTAEALRNGWMHTGDGGYMDADGFIYVVDRIKDMIVTGGENVYSAEVENAILRMPQVSMCAVVGVPHEKWGESVHAVVVLREGATLTSDQVIEHCRTLIAGYKCPRSIDFRDALPVSAAGKILKYQLREPFWKGRSRRIN